MCVASPSELAGWLAGWRRLAVAALLPVLLVLAGACSSPAGHPDKPVTAVKLSYCDGPRRCDRTSSG
ncbi:MAG TPA: hypothetical protein VMU94_09550 [Streptosporangiaceae bacterium]|nr:hypothetical protein [Streptosporangiaceae bacterium]